MIIEGDFAKSTLVTLREYKGDNPELENGETLEKWVMQLSQLDEGQTYTLRYLPPAVEKGYQIQVFVRQDGQWVPVETEQAGSYLSFACDTDRIVFCAVQVKESPVKSYVLLGLGAAALLGIGIGILRSGRKKKATQKKEAEKSETTSVS